MVNQYSVRPSNKVALSYQQRVLLPVPHATHPALHTMHHHILRIGIDTNPQATHL